MFSNLIYCILEAVVFANCVEDSTSQIYWYLADPPVTFGANVQLVCNTTCCIRDSEEAVTTWAIGSDDSSLYSLSRNMISTNISKYEIFTSRHECRLTIKNFEPNDVNKTYTCYSEFQKYSKILTLNPDNFEQQPSANSILAWKNETDDESPISFLIKNVYPEPRCLVYYKETNITSGIKIESKKDGMMFSTKIDIYHRIVVGLFNVMCLIGTKTHHIHFYAKHNECSTSDQKSVIISNIIWLFAFLILSTYLIYVKIQFRNATQTAKQDDEISLHFKSKSGKSSSKNMQESHNVEQRSSLSDISCAQKMCIPNSGEEQNNVVNATAEISNLELKECLHISSKQRAGPKQDTIPASNITLSERKRIEIFKTEEEQNETHVHEEDESPYSRETMNEEDPLLSESEDPFAESSQKGKRIEIFKTEKEQNETHVHEEDESSYSRETMNEEEDPLLSESEDPFAESSQIIVPYKYKLKPKARLRFHSC